MRPNDTPAETSDDSDTDGTDSDTALEFHPDAHPKATEITGDRRYGEWGQCVVPEAKHTGERCRGFAKGPHGKCRFHGGATPTKDENPNIGAGAAEPGEARAERHGLRSNPNKFYGRLSAERQEEVDVLYDALLSRYVEYHGREPDAGDRRDCWEIALDYVKRDYARDALVENWADSGNPVLELVTYQDDSGNERRFKQPAEILEMINENRRESRLQRKTKGLERDGQTQQAEGIQNMADVWRDVLSEGKDSESEDDS